MGCVEQAVLEFDGEVQAPWRPRLVAEPVPVDPVDAPGLRRPGAGRSSSRVGVCRPSVRATPRDRPPAAGRGRGVSAVPPAAGRGRPACASPGGLAGWRSCWRSCGGVLLGSLLDSLVSGAAGDGLHLVGVSSVVVEPGDTLWSIAESVADEADVRVVVDRIQELNRLEGSSLVPGQVLQLP